MKRIPFSHSRLGFDSRQKQGFFSLPSRPDRLWGLPSLLSNGYPGLFPGVKLSGREANHSPPYSAEFKNAWSYTFSPPRHEI